MINYGGVYKTIENEDSFWFTLLHEIGHILHGDFDISFEQETGEQELLVDKFVDDKNMIEFRLKIKL